jgi:2-oxoisovalerate dehydrogenase E1 component
MGQDIAGYGGVFKVSEGFLDLFGRDRVRNTPIIESGIIGAAIGLSLEGFKPVVEMQFADFISCGFNQIVNNLSKGRYRWMPPMNVTIRAPHGAGVGAGPFHSQSPEGWFMQHPGLRIIVPGTVEDARNMLYTSLFDPTPVLFFEHKKLYRSLKENISGKAEFTNLDKAIVRKPGTDLTLITYGMGLQWAQQVIPGFEKSGRSIELIDLRSLAPIDWDTLKKSVNKTGKVLLLQEPSEIMGPMSEISAGITERCFEFLDAPVMRCSSLDMPVPFSTALEKEYLAENCLKHKLEQILSY